MQTHESPQIQGIHKIIKLCEETILLVVEKIIEILRNYDFISFQNYFSITNLTTMCEI